jgi:hypothetical protein
MTTAISNELATVKALIKDLEDDTIPVKQTLEKIRLNLPDTLECLQLENHEIRLLYSKVYSIATAPKPQTQRTSYKNASAEDVL